MNSRERVIKTFNHEQPDRVPIDFGGHRSSGIAVQAYKKLREYLGLPKSELYIYDVVQQLAAIEDDMLDFFSIDTVQLGNDFYKNSNYWQEWKLHDGTEVKIPKHINIKVTDNGDYYINTPKGKMSCIQKKDCLYFEQTEFPYLNSDEREFNNLEDELKEVLWVDVSTPPAPLSIDEIAKHAKKLRESTQRAVYGIFGGGFLEPGEQAFKIDNYLMEIALDGERILNFNEKLLEIHMRKLIEYLEKVGPYIDIIGVSDDLGMQSGSQISPAMFNTFLKPFYAKEWATIKEKAPHLKICMHSCGSIYNLLPDLIEAGLDSFNPVQISCANMEPTRLKNSFGDNMVFWGGGCDTGYVLPLGTPNQIKEHVKNNIEIFKPNGGFIFQQVHNILADVPPENIVAMFEAAKEYGVY